MSALMFANPARKRLFLGLGCLLVVYLSWGSIYLAIRLVVREGSGFPPFIMSGMRLCTAGAITLAIEILRRQRWQMPWPEFRQTAALGIFFWPIGCSGLVWAEQHVDSGYAALIAAGTIPLWGATLSSFLNRRWPSSLLVTALFVGLGGVALISEPTLRHASMQNWAEFLALLSVGLCWGLAPVFQQRQKITCSALSNAAWQQLAGGLVFLLFSWLAKEPWPTPDATAWGAWWVLVIVGSIIAFSSYLIALKLLPVTVVMTYAYVEPLIAVLLGYFILDEELTSFTISGIILIVLSVAGVFRDKLIHPSQVSVPLDAQKKQIAP